MISKDLKPVSQKKEKPIKYLKKIKGKQFKA
jgi:hypothetical protein